MAYRTTIRSLCQMYVGDVSHQSVLAGYWSDHVGVEWPTAPQLDLCVICMLVTYRTTVTSGCRISVGGVSYLPHLRVEANRISHVSVSQESSGASYRSNILVSCAYW